MSELTVHDADLQGNGAPDAEASSQLDNVQTSGAPPMTDIVPRLPHGVTLPGALMVGERGVQVQPDGFYVRKGKGKATRPISNFLAFVSAHRVRDDGITVIAEFAVDVYHFGRWYQVNVGADDFAQLRWLNAEIGPSAIIYPRCKEMVLAAIQELTAYVHRGPVPRITVYSHLGWRELRDGTRVYLNAAGALGAEGIVPGVEVGLPGDFARYYLEGAGTDDGLREAVRSSLSILDLGPDTVMAPLLAATYRAPLGEANATVFLVGYTGSLKSTLAALAQQHFGSEMDVRHLPASWSATDNALEALAFVAKDSLLVVDDFNPTGSPSEVAGWHAKAERVIRAVGNSSGRGRLSADSELQVTRPARCLALATGEDVPRGQSLRARLLGVGVQKGDIDLAALTVAQEAAASGVLACAMAGYVQWLAANWDSVDRVRAERSAQLRTNLYDISPHPFTATIVVELGTGFRAFLDFAVDIGAVTDDVAEALWSRAWQALTDVLRAQQEGQREANPVDKFLRYLTSAISAGRAHVAGTDGDVPSAYDGRAWGWKQRPERVRYTESGRPMDGEGGEWEPVGMCVGWLDRDHLYLDPAEAMGVAETQARRMSDSLAVGEATMGKRLNERGLLTVEVSRDTLKVRKVIDHRRRQVWHLPASVMGVGARADGPDPMDVAWEAASGAGGPGPEDPTTQARVTDHREDDPSQGGLPSWVPAP